MALIQETVMVHTLVESYETSCGAPVNYINYLLYFLNKKGEDYLQLLICDWVNNKYN